jgi:SAM-dependent methyltransferase
MRWPPTACRTSGRPHPHLDADELLDRRRRQADRRRLDFAELPFASQSLDLVVLPHVLEFAAEPHQVLREVERVLIPEGQVIICGFNPASLWGARQGMGASRAAATCRRRRIHLYAAHERLVKIVESRRHAQPFRLLRAAISHHPVAQPLRLHGKAGQRWWPYLGAVYIVHAIKRVKGMNIIGPAWNKKSARRRKAVPAPTATNATNRRA